MEAWKALKTIVHNQEVGLPRNSACEMHKKSDYSTLPMFYTTMIKKSYININNTYFRFIVRNKTSQKNPTNDKKKE